MTPESKKRLIRFSVGSIFIIGIAYAVQFYLGFMNIGQEFGVYGPYNRTLNAVEEMEDFTVSSSRIRRTFHYKLFSTLENFAVKVENARGQTATLTFEKGAPEFEETDRERIMEYIRLEANTQIAENEPL